MSDSSLVEITLEAGVFRLVLNRPDKRNALSLAMIDAISGALETADRNLNARVVVIAANGPVYSSGHDLRELTQARKNADGGHEFFSQTMRRCSAMMQQIVNLRLPVIAEIRGTATAAGCQLVASCDLAVAGMSAKFATPGVNIGLFCSTPMVALSRNISNKFAMEMLLTGDFCDAKRAAEIGLVNRCVDDEFVSETVCSFTDRITSKSRITIKTGKQAFYNQTMLPLPQAYDYCSQVMVENMMRHDAEEGLNAFLEKRKPQWRDM